MNLKKEGIHDIIIVCSFIVLALLLYLYTEPSLTGLPIKEKFEEITFDTLSDYSYNSSLVEVADSQVKLKEQAVTSAWITYNYTDFGIEKAYYDYSNKTDKVNKLDGDFYELEDKELFEISFSEFLDNSDTVLLHANSSGQSSTVYLCNASSICDSTNNYGSISYNGSENDYVFTLSNLQNPMKSFTVISVNTIKTDFINSSKGDILNAITEPEDKTSKLTSQDGNETEVEDDNILNIIFSDKLQDNDTLSIYLGSDGNSNINLCQPTDFCTNNYGSISLSSTESWYNLTVSNLQYPTNTLSLVTDNEIEIDYIRIYRTTPEYHSEINYSYGNASIETKEFSLNKESLSANFSSEETLNSQQIIYYYSLNNESYNVTTNNITLNNASTIKFKADLITNATDTPTLSSIAFTYNYDQCDESWSCTGWSECSGLSTQTRTCADLNSCGATSLKPAETQGCVKKEYEINQTETISVYKNETVKINATNLELNILSNLDITGVNLTITRSINDTNIPGNRIFEDFKIDADENLNSNINLTEFKVYYNEEDLADVYENTLKLYRFNETDSEWHVLPFILNAEENYIIANLTHFSIYGVFGGSSEESSSSSSTGSGGRKSFSKPANENPRQESQTIEAQTPQQNEGSQSQEQEFSEFSEEETLQELTGQAITEVESSRLKTRINWSLTGLIILNVLFILISRIIKRIKASAQQIQ